MTKNRFQGISFNSISEFLEFMPEKELKIIELLRGLILQYIPDCEEKLSYNILFYHRNKNIFFIWPSSIAWGMMNQDGVRLGLIHGHLLNDRGGYFEKGNRNQVLWKDFTHVDEVNTILLKSYILEAAVIDENFRQS